MSAPPPLLPAPDLTLDLSSQTPQTLNVNTTLKINGNGQAQLEIDADGDFGTGPGTVSWALYVMSFTGVVCTAKANWVAPQYLGDGDYSFMHTVPVPTLGRNFLIVDLCWTAQSPLTVNSSYLSATFPPVTVASQTGTLTRTISFGLNGLAAYQLGGATPPPTVGQQGWSWQDPLGTTVGDQAVNPLYVSGTSIVGIQQASNDTFYSGIAFGVGLGAVIALLLALPDLVRKRAERRKTQTGVGAPTTAPDESPGSGDGSVEAGDSVEAT